jgi:Omp85 superfamily domain
VTSVPTSANVVLALVCLLFLGCPSGASAQPIAQNPAAPRPNELDAFMEKVIQRRDFNRQQLEQYVLDEIERVEALGPSRMPVYRHAREYTWYVRDGLHVRSPVRFNGVAVGDKARQEYEESWARRERQRLADRGKKDGKAQTDEPDPVVEDLAGASPVPTPRFVSEAYFMDFKFEPGNYYLAGREQIEGQTVLRIEYYPTRMFGGDGERRKDRDDRRSRDTEERIERQMNKTALVTIWVDPAEHQIVKYTFDNVWMDFLPAAWLVRVDDIRASMTMGQPFRGVWLPREINVHAGITLASGSLEATYERRFTDYKQADVKSLIRIPKGPGEDDDVQEDSHDGSCAESPGPAAADDGCEPAAPGPPDATRRAEQGVQNAAEIVSEIRVHGNAYLLDSEVIRLAGVTLGQTLGPDGAAEIERRLKASGFFETVEVRKRYRSLDGASDVALILLVHEQPGQKSATTAERPSPWPWSRVSSRLMFLPIIAYDDGYGFTYGGRISTIDLLGGGERLSVPLTWGGTRRAALEVDRTFKSGILTRVDSSVAISQRENPHVEIADQRLTWTARAERSVAGLVRGGVETSQGTVEFGPLDDRLWTIGADVALDTRGDPGFPRNAVLLGARWNGLHVRGLDTINRYTTDARGYLGLIRQAVLAARVQYSTADRPVPPYERLLLGGASNLRGFRAGAYDGDRLLATSAEIRVPITSVLSGAKLGVSAFMDAAKVFDVGQRLTDAPWRQGVGAGVFLIATVVRVNLDVARGLKDGDTRVHLSTGFGF